jgi:hypothetical protein
MARFTKKNSIVVDADYAEDLVRKIERTILDKHLDLYIAVSNVKGTDKKRIVVCR